MAADVTENGFKKNQRSEIRAKTLKDSPELEASAGRVQHRTEAYEPLLFLYPLLEGALALNFCLLQRHCFYHSFLPTAGHRDAEKNLSFTGKSVRSRAQSESLMTI